MPQQHCQSSEGMAIAWQRYASLDKGFTTFQCLDTLSTVPMMASIKQDELLSHINYWHKYHNKKLHSTLQLVSAIVIRQQCFVTSAREIKWSCTRFLCLPLFSISFRWIFVDFLEGNRTWDKKSSIIFSRQYKYFMETKHPFNGLFSRTTWVSQHQTVKPFWILMK